MKTHIVFRVDGNAEVGLGHLSRCLYLARALETEGADSVVFATRYPAFFTSLAGGRFRVVTIPSRAGLRGEIEIIRRGLPRGGAKCLIFDVGTVEGKSVAAARGVFDVICTTDDHGAGARHADFIFNTVIDGLDNRVRRVGAARLYSGAKYVFLPPEIIEFRKRRRPPGREVKKALVAMGGSDPDSLTPVVLRGCRRAMPAARLDVIVGAGFSEKNLLAALDAADGNTRIISRPAGILPYIAASDLGVSSGGVTLTEMAALGLPSVVLSQGRFAHEAAMEFAVKDCCVLLGRGKDVSETKLLKSLESLAADHDRRRAMYGAGRSVVDGKGARRVAKIVLESMREKSST